MRLLSLACAVLLLTALAACVERPPIGGDARSSGAATQPTIGDLVAASYGADGFDHVTRIAFTFNVRTPDGGGVSRHWVWEPATGSVTAGAGDGATTYRRDSVGDDLKDTDAKFVNDQYWLLFPLHLRWDRVAVSDDGTMGLPIGDGAARCLTVTFPPEGGYTPGDVYELFVGDDYRIAAWNFRRGGGAEGRAMTWEQHQQAGPLTLSLSHYNADGTFRVWFTDVEVHTANGDVATASATD